MKITVQVREDHLGFLSRARPMTALAELMWNALDAEATEVYVCFHENALGGLDSLTIRDNGHGLGYGDARAVFGSLGGSWKQEGQRTTRRGRVLHGKFGKGRFRAFALGEAVCWEPVFLDNGKPMAYQIEGVASHPGEFTVSHLQPLLDGEPGMCVTIREPANGVAALRGVKALQDVTDLFAPYMRMYPEVRIVYDGTPLDPAASEDRVTNYPLPALVTESGVRVTAELTVVEWLIPGKRGLALCDQNGFSLHMLRKQPLFRGFSYTAYLKSSHLTALDREGLLPLEDMTPDVRLLTSAARVSLREHFARRETERQQDLVSQWRDEGVYPYGSHPHGEVDSAERAVFDAFAARLNAMSGLAQATPAVRGLAFRLLQELVKKEPTAVAHILDDIASSKPMTTTGFSS